MVNPTVRQFTANKFSFFELFWSFLRFIHMVNKIILHIGCVKMEIAGRAFTAL